MKTALIIHGIFGKAGENWEGWLKQELEKKGYKVHMPQMPNSKHPDRQEWLEYAYELVKDIDPSKLTIIGHSLGVPTGLDLVEKLNTRIDTFASVAGFYEDYGHEINSYFMKEKDIDIEKVKSLIEKAIVLYGDNDPYVTQQALENLAKGLGVESLILKEGGHINEEAGYTELPEISKYL